MPLNGQCKGKNNSKLYSEIVSWVVFTIQNLTLKKLPWELCLSSTLDKFHRSNTSSQIEPPATLIVYTQVCLSQLNVELTISVEVMKRNHRRVSLRHTDPLQRGSVVRCKGSIVEGPWLGVQPCLQLLHM